MTTRTTARALILPGCLSLLTAGCASTGEPRSAPPLLAAGYDSPQAAADALVAALRAWSADDLREVLGDDVDRVLFSGDEVHDRNAADRFVKAYDQKHQLLKDAKGNHTLVVGTDDWPLPIPITFDAESKVYFFDTDAGAEEIINRRIGRNELDAIEVCRAIVDAQREYAVLDPDGDGVPEYARKIVSDEGKKNGLFWPIAEGQTPSPLGPLIADAVAEGYRSGTAGTPRPYHGYYYRLLSGQGPHATGGARDFIINGRMIGGFAVVAFPAEYGESGIMTFIVSHEGQVLQKDFGDDTEKVAKAMTIFDPDPTWKKLEPPKQP